MYIITSIALATPVTTEDYKTAQKVASALWKADQSTSVYIHELCGQVDGKPTLILCAEYK